VALSLLYCIFNLIMLGITKNILIFIPACLLWGLLIILLISSKSLSKKKEKECTKTAKTEETETPKKRLPELKQRGFPDPPKYFDNIFKTDLEETEYDLD